ncbi:hypothetical protein BBO99_00002459 [Phytophthora kernoviae]|uniref:Uncharacterized protein n=2 Tax=Phytophthora kernoviae TaxID=325452 RepID=A0A3R7H7W5_9STRA|nr:hypothetical protein G195_004217 [Phytophthora kernoviae 00238/432]KAG2527143.1 hypothetical protein JM16_001930 [Phytophthora kernoviae]KAG2528544.1 hypothetical protein JM18_002032 [Phytophthora kernoviae]RLN31897.1 hypothetical protein BBI17_000529 [Phytophthora kernoviae]RLN83056.1 hypothetical protein BBO99_00002459 [Phytophthora kernoviae]
MEIAHGATSFDDHCRAIENFSLAIAIRATQPRFFLARGNAFRAIGELERAAKDYGASLALDDRSALYYANRGACYRKLNKTAKALEDLTNAIELDSRKAPHYFNRALVLYDAGFYREAIIDFSKALEDGSTAATGSNTAASSAGTNAPPGGGIGIRLEYRALQTRAKCYRRLGHLPKCIEDLQTAIKLDSRNAPAFSALALAHFECGDFERAAEGFTQAIELNSNNASYFSYRGLCYYRQGQAFAVKQQASAATMSYMSAAEQLEAAFADIEMALTLCPSGTSYQIGMAMITQLKQHHVEARTMFEEIASTYPENRKSVLVQFHLALCCHALGDHERALELLTDALDALPDEPLFLEARGLMLQELRAHTMALADFSHALRLLDGFEDRKANMNLILRLHYLRGESALRLGQFQNAVDDCSAAIAGGYTADMAAHNARGMALRGLSEYDRALLELNTCVAQAPKNDIFRFHRALCLMECSRYSEALPDLHETATRNTTDTKLLYYIGLCYYHEHQPDECVIFMERALEHEPTQELLPNLHYHIGLSHALEGRNMDAVEHFTSAYDHSLTEVESIKAGNNQEEEPHEADDKQARLQQLHEVQLLYIHERAKALQLERYHAEALADFSFVIAQQPTNAHAYFRRGFAHKALGDFKTAASDLQTARLLDPNNLQLVVNYKELHDVECIVLCVPGKEKRY